jgi:hypothetical protein
MHHLTFDDLPDDIWGKVIARVGDKDVISLGKASPSLFLTTLQVLSRGSPAFALTVESQELVKLLSWLGKRRYVRSRFPPKGIPSRTSRPTLPHVHFTPYGLTRSPSHLHLHPNPPPAPLLHSPEALRSALRTARLAVHLPADASPALAVPALASLLRLLRLDRIQPLSPFRALHAATRLEHLELSVSNQLCDHLQHARDLERLKSLRVATAGLRHDDVSARFLSFL